MENDKQKVTALKERLKEIESQDGFNKNSPFYLALKDRIDNLANVILK